MNDDMKAEVVRLTTGIQEILQLDKASHGVGVLALVNTLVCYVMEAPPHCQVKVYNTIADLFARSTQEQINKARKTNAEGDR